ncbi:hypothetical protein DOTSEDRAFT_23982 [Dothistroma septosporum NZE10]|uniref:Uncharacterized protein n=1 Tax=Dothistroma septosporum (strain NZE10 / CBS 128990) TaxID=675120 RepID=N1PN62_DOTSN|nr:hypothetical protein DOTSEDRAFT_23982 [Dothistroma septosporum NZE10]
MPSTPKDERGVQRAERESQRRDSGVAELSSKVDGWQLRVPDMAQQITAAGVMAVVRGHGLHFGFMQVHEQLHVWTVEVIVLDVLEIDARRT